MLVKFSFFLIALVAGITAERYAEIEDLENLIEERLRKLEELNKNIENATVYYDEMTLERIESLNYLYHTVSAALDNTSREAVFKGINNKKPFSNFECVSREVDLAVNKLKKAHESFPASSEEIKDKSFMEIEPYLVIVLDLKDFAYVLLETKKKEISETQDVNQKKKILEEVADILKYIDGIVAEIEKKAFKVKYSFFEKFVNLCYSTESTFKKTQREDLPKILRCV